MHHVNKHLTWKPEEDWTYQRTVELVIVTPPVSSVSHTVHTCTQVVQCDRCTPLYTGIDNLREVKGLLKDVIDWQSLGLELSRGPLFHTKKDRERLRQG